MIVPVWLSHGRNLGTEQLVYALLDDQSDTTFIADTILNHLGVSGPEKNLLLSTMHATDELIKSRKIGGLIVQDFKRQVTLQLPKAFSRKTIPAKRSQATLSQEDLQFLKKMEKEFDKLLMGIMRCHSPFKATPRNCQTTSHWPYVDWTSWRREWKTTWSIVKITWHSCKTSSQRVLLRGCYTNNDPMTMEGCGTSPITECTTLKSLTRSELSSIAVQPSWATH